MLNSARALHRRDQVSLRNKLFC